MLKNNDTQTLGQVKGMCTLLTKHCKSEFRKKTAQAYLNGTGAVALTMSTLFCER
jgi:hypothetical protein